MSQEKTLNNKDFDTDKLAVAMEYINKRGWIIHPLSGHEDKKQSPGKRPLLKEWQQLEKVTDEDVKKWFSNTDPYFKDCNIGLQCGKRSGVTVIDIDHELFMDELFNGFEIETLRSRRTTGRGHIYFIYNPNLPAKKHHVLGIEILSDGSNAVLPPSIHTSGNLYKWNNPDTQIIEMPVTLVENLNKLVEREKKLNALINKCRPCFKHYWKDEKKICHGSTARDFLGAFCSELFNKGADLDLIRMFAKVIYQTDYDETKTLTEFNGWTQKGYKPWTCEKLKERCAGFTECDNCKVKKSGRNNVNEKTYSQASALIGYVGSEDVELFHDDRGDPFVRVKMEGKSMTMPVQGRQFRRWITGQFFDDTGTAPGSDAITGALNVVEAKACRKGKEYKLHNRIAGHDGAFWYDMGDGIAVKIGEKGWEVVKNPPILFKSYKHQKTHSLAQILPYQDCCRCRMQQCKGEHVKRILDFVNLNDEKERLLFVVYLISCFIPDIPHPIPVLHGDKGSSKSTVFKFLKEIIDPSVLRIMTFPKDNTELVQKLDHHHFAPFDNVTTLSEWQSDALCRACTGEGFSKREFYTNDEDIIFDYQRCIGLNGVNIVASKADLLDRAILLKLDRIPKDRRKPEDVLWRLFNEVKGEILAGVFTILSRAAAIKSTISLTERPRMADFMEWGCAVSEAMGDGWKAFYDAYTANIQSQNKEAIEASPVGELIMRFMDDKTTWEGRASDLLTALEGLAEVHKINTRSKSFPKAANTLTRRINEVKTNLLEEGIRFDTKREEDKRTLFLCRVSGNTVSTVIPSGTLLRDSVKPDGIEKTYRQDTVMNWQADDTCKSADGIPSGISAPQKQDGKALADDTDANDDISRHNLGGAKAQETCDICQKPLSGVGDIENGLPGQGKIHKDCKHLTISICFLKDVPKFTGIDMREYGAFKIGEVAYIPATNACGLILKRAAQRIENTVNLT